MTKLSQDAKARIREKIAEAERTTQSELVCLITRRSARYVFFPSILAALLALFLPVVGPLLSLAGGPELEIGFQHQTVLFIVLAGLLVMTPLGLLVTPRSVKRQNAQRFATEQFFANRLHETDDRAAILLFVSLDEHVVEVVADTGINEKVDQSTWDGMVKDFVSRVKANEIEAGFLGIVAAAGAVLTEHFPAKERNEDELPNHLIELDGPGYLS